MDHIAIMKKSLGFIPKILSGEKTIESRWYMTRRSPWNNIHKGDTVYFKNAGEKITIKADVEKIIQGKIESQADMVGILDIYGERIGLTKPFVIHKLARYYILVFLSDPISIQPFQINKKGFGSANARMSLEDITTIKI